jgi:RNA polymerase sigma factor (sigma-70 family)
MYSPVKGPLYPPGYPDEDPRSAAGFPERERVYARLQPLVRRLIRTYGEDAEQQKDLHGEIYVRFCALYESYDPARGIPLQPYLIRNLITSTYTYARSQWRLNRCAQTLQQLEMREQLHREDPTNGWIEGMEQQDWIEHLRESVERLPERQRRVIRLRYYDSLSYGEIAGRLGVTEATVRSLQRHGVHRLRQWAKDRFRAPAEE